jgi:hypothetical protein
VLPLLALVVLGAWLLSDPELRRDARNAVGESDEREIVGTSGRSAATITELSEAQRAEPGDRAVLRNVAVTAVTGDATFWIGNGSERLRVQFGEHAPGLEEDRMRIRSGQHVDLSGMIRRSQHDRYLHADQIRIR